MTILRTAVRLARVVLVVSVVARAVIGLVGVVWNFVLMCVNRWEAALALFIILKMVLLMICGAVIATVITILLRHLLRLLRRHLRLVIRVNVARVALVHARVVYGIAGSAAALVKIANVIAVVIPTTQMILMTLTILTRLTAVVSCL
jgi:hypothetical protein